MSPASAPLVPSELAAARSQADSYHRSGAMTLLGLAAFWGVAAALYQWAGPVTGQIALLLGSVAAHPVAWLVLRLAGGHAFLPRTNPLNGLYYATTLLPIIGVIGAGGLAHARPDAFFASAMLGLASASVITSWLYERPGYLVLAAVQVALPVLAWFFAAGTLPWFGLLGIVLLVVAGGLFLRLSEARAESTAHAGDQAMSDAAGTEGADVADARGAGADGTDLDGTGATGATRASGTGTGTGTEASEAPSRPNGVGQHDAAAHNTPRPRRREREQFFDQSDTEES